MKIRLVRPSGEVFSLPKWIKRATKLVDVKEMNHRNEFETWLLEQLKITIDNLYVEIQEVSK